MLILPINNENKTLNFYASRNIPNIDKKKLVKLLDAGYSYHSIGKEFNLSHSTIRKYCTNLGLKSKNIQKPKIDYDSIDTDLIKTMIEEGNSLSQISKAIGKTISCVRKILKRIGLQTQQSQIVSSIDEAGLAAMLDMGLSQKQIAKNFGIDDVGALTPLIKKYGKKASQSIVDSIQKEDLERCINAKMTMQEIIDLYKVSPQYIRKKMKEFDLKTVQMQKNTRTISAKELKACVQKGMSAEEISSTFNIGISKISRLLKSYNIRTKYQIQQEAIPKEKIESLLKDCDTKTELAEMLGIPLARVGKLLKKYNLNLEKEINDIPDANILRDKIKKYPYISIDELAKSINCSPIAVEYGLNKFGIKIYRPHSILNFKSINYAKWINYLLRSGDTPTQIGELCGLSSETARKKITNLAQKYKDELELTNLKHIPDDKLSPSREELVKCINSINTNAIFYNVIYKHEAIQKIKLFIHNKLMLSKASIDYLIRKYDLQKIIDYKLKNL